MVKKMVRRPGGGKVNLRFLLLLLIVAVGSLSSFLFISHHIHDDSQKINDVNKFIAAKGETQGQLRNSLDTTPVTSGISISANNILSGHANNPAPTAKVVESQSQKLDSDGGGAENDKVSTTEEESDIDTDEDDRKRNSGGNNHNTPHDETSGDEQDYHEKKSSHRKGSKTKKASSNSKKQNSKKAVQDIVAPSKPKITPGNTYVDVKLGDVTIVTAYYRIESKHSDDDYDKWIANMMSVTDPMVIFTSKDLAPRMRKQRAHAEELTKIIVKPVSESLMGTNFTREFWQGEFKKDPEAHKHKSVELYWIWNEKPNWLKTAADMNPFGSSFFAWIDCGYLRDDDSQYAGKQLIQRLPASIADNEVMLLNVVTYKIKDMDPNGLLHDNRVGGNFIGGRAQGIQQWYNDYYAVMWKFIEEGHFVGKDQHMMASVCAQKGPTLCFLVAPKHPTKKLDRVSKWFIIVPALHGDIPLVRAWFPAPPSPAVNKEEGPVVLEDLLTSVDEAHIARAHKFDEPEDIKCNRYVTPPRHGSMLAEDDPKLQQYKEQYLNSLTTAVNSHCADFFSIDRSQRTIPLGIRGRSSNMLLQYLYGRIVADAHNMGLMDLYNVTENAQKHYPNFVFKSDPKAAVAKHRLTANCGPHFQNYRFYRNERCISQCIFTPSADGLSAAMFDLGPNDVVIHYRAPFFKFRGKSPHGVTRENLSHTAPLYSYFARILQRLKNKGTLGKVWLLCDSGLKDDHVISSLKKDFNAKIHGGTHYQDHYLGRIAPIFIGSFGTFTWTIAFMSSAREIHLPYVGIMKLGSSWNWWDALFIDDDPRIHYHDISGDGMFQSADEVKNSGSEFAKGIAERDALDNFCQPRRQIIPKGAHLQGEGSHSDESHEEDAS